MSTTWGMKSFFSSPNRSTEALMGCQQRATRGHHVQHDDDSSVPQIDSVADVVANDCGIRGTTYDRVHQTQRYRCADQCEHDHSPPAGCGFHRADSERHEDRQHKKPIAR